MQGDLSHLTDDKIIELMERYYNGEAAKKLIFEFELSVPPSHLYKLFPPEAFPDYKCDYCGSVLVADRQSKSMGKRLIYKNSLYCPACGHKPYTACKCNNCLQVEIEQTNKRINNINISFGCPPAPIEFQNLPFIQKVYLGSLCRAHMCENTYEIEPFIRKNLVLAPLNTFCSEIYDELKGSDSITVSPTSQVDAFLFDENNWPNEYYVDKVTYNLNLKFPSNKKDLLSDILNPTYYSINNQDEALVLWRKIAVAECIEYLQYSINKIGFDFSPGEKTYTTMDILLNDLSVSQIYRVIWKSVADASKLYLEKSMTKRHAANSIIGMCERYAERAIINHWNLPRYGRIRDLPQSIISEFFFNRVLGIGDIGFDMPPTIV